MKRFVLAVILLMALAAPVLGQNVRVCLLYDQMIKALETEPSGETRLGHGAAFNGWRLEVWRGQGGEKSWTIIAVNRDGLTCIVSVVTGWVED